MVLYPGIFELAWVAVCCFGFSFCTCFGLYWIGRKKYRQKKAKPKSVLVPADAMRTNRPAIEAWRQQKRKSPQNKKPSSNSAQTSRDTTQQQNNNSNSRSSSQQGTATFGYNYLDYQGIVQPPYLHGISPQVVPNYINNMNYFGPRPQLSVVREDSREQETEIGSTESLDNESDRRSCDQIQSTSLGNVRPTVSDLNLDSNFEVILLSPSTPPPPYSDNRVIAIV